MTEMCRVAATELPYID